MALGNGSLIVHSSQIQQLIISFPLKTKGQPQEKGLAF
jgi:hypothetical protein